MGEHGYSLALEFDTVGPDFVRGVEIGRLWEQLKSSEVVVQEIRTDNAEMLMRISTATGRHVMCEELNDDWLRARFEPRAVASDRSRLADAT